MGFGVSLQDAAAGFGVNVVVSSALVRMAADLGTIHGLLLAVVTNEVGQEEDGTW